ncbi:MAG: molybdopterin biosynthesis protein MoeY [Burkholderiales bacterium PBB5]|nr:MAG: molybdopterin biosynthesis protein MoeY [Burkholderiales bacterium PBB5]
MHTALSPAVRRVLEQARWAPSGDNTQPWRFEVLGPDSFVVHGHDTRDHCVYDLDGRPSQMALGMLLQTIEVAASGIGQRARITPNLSSDDRHPTFTVVLQPDGRIPVSPLLAAVPRRSVNRRPLSARPVTGAERHQLELAVGAGYQLRWIEGWGPKSAIAWLMMRNAKLRLTMREAFEVHRSIIDWNKRFSPHAVPDQALGVDPGTLKLMRWAMGDWNRLVFMNRFLAGTWAPRIMMDLLPSLLCGAHVAIVRDVLPVTVDDHVDAGRAVQRFWLQATMLGLQHQPELTPLIFSRYIRHGLTFTSSPAAQRLAERLQAHSSRTLGPDLPRIVWLGRLGEAGPAAARSTRRSLSDLSLDPH